MLSPMAAGLGFGIFNKSNDSSKSSKPTPTPKPKSKDLPSPESAPSKSYWNLPTPSNTTWYGLGALALGAAAAGTAYYRREDLANGWKYGSDHLSFVGNLWDEEGMRKRLGDVATLCESRNIVFRKWVVCLKILQKLPWSTCVFSCPRAKPQPFNSYYTYLPPDPPNYLVARTFTVLPPLSHPLFKRWIPATSTLAKDEVGAHMYMFNPKTNDGFYDLGLNVVNVIGERVEEEGVRASLNGVAGEGVAHLGEEMGFVAEDGVKGVEGRSGMIEEEDGMEDQGAWREEKRDGKSVLVEL